MSAKAVVAARRSASCAAARSSCRSPPRGRRGAHAPRAARRRRARRGPRRRHGAALALLHAGARRRDHGLRHPRPRRLGAPHRLRQRRRRCVEPGRAAHRGRVGPRRSPARFVVSVEVEALDRSRLLRDVADVLAEHHVNILVVHHARPRPTGSPSSASTSSSPTPATSSRSSPRSSGSTRSTTPTGCCPATPTPTCRPGRG